MQIIETCPKCGHDMYDYTVTITPGKEELHVKECLNCGWAWERREDAEVKRVPFVPNGWIEHA